MSSNRLSLNPSKTELIWLDTRQQLLKLDFALLAAQFPQFSHLSKVLMMVLTERLKGQSEEYMTEEQAGFRRDRSTMQHLLAPGLVKT